MVPIVHEGIVEGKENRTKQTIYIMVYPLLIGIPHLSW